MPGISKTSPQVWPRMAPARTPAWIATLSLFSRAGLWLAHREIIRSQNIPLATG